MMVWRRLPHLPDGLGRQLRTRLLRLFSNSPADFSGNQFAVADSSSATVAGVGSADTVVLDSGGAGDLYYDMTSHVLAGAVDGATFGQGLG